MTMSTTSIPAATATKTTGLHTVALGSGATLPKGVVKATFKVTTPIMKKAADFMLNKVNGLWNKIVAPRIVSGMASKGGNVRMPSASFYANEDGLLRSTPAPGYKWYQRKGYDPKTGLCWIWVVVS